MEEEDSFEKQKKPFKIGDSVILKTGEGPLMLIENFQRDEVKETVDMNLAICTWKKKGKTLRKTYHVDLLMHDGPFLISTGFDVVE